VACLLRRWRSALITHNKSNSAEPLLLIVVGLFALSAAANATQFNAGFLGLSRVEWNCFVCFFGLPRAFGRLAWAPFRSFSAAGNANKNQRNSIPLNFFSFIHSSNSLIGGLMKESIITVLIKLMKLNKDKKNH